MKLQRRCALIGLALVVAVSGCRHAVETAPAIQHLPASLLGEFVDDYGIAYSISLGEWFQRPRARYHIVDVDTLAGYLVAQNDANNPGDRGLWTRIDWVKLDRMAPYEWAFCLSAYAAPTQEAAKAVSVAKRETPRTGCNGYPFSRMRRAGPADTLRSTPYAP